MHKATTDQINTISFANLKNILANLHYLSGRFVSGDPRAQQYIFVVGKEVGNNLIPTETEVEVSFKATVNRVLDGFVISDEHKVVLAAIRRDPVLQNRVKNFFLEDFPGILKMNLISTNYNIPR